ncbi:adenine phosphoribosyltransferase [Microbacterium candidum]|uniref:Adenine phosphoribosyltransferase n=1 Tax=Microbacterium candidum TaxID=3041922 RepID=A0ABT7MUJ8_9MICO|nr:adenine phosphoribosyltransferase [Microbacterium sp. ASV49]MDL9978128.1 adenine phosphoribosyltransferase [Microbacterium sp. ASV49]
MDELDRAERLIATIPDFPQEGVVFRDISPLLADAAALRVAVDALTGPFAGQFDAVAGIEARGFLLAGAAAIAAGVGLVPIRKAGKLPRVAASVSYSLEYGEAVVEVPEGLPRGMRVLLVDDVLATGGTLRAGREVLGEIGCTVTGTAALMEIAALGGRAVLGGDVHSVFVV